VCLLYIKPLNAHEKKIKTKKKQKKIKMKKKMKKRKKNEKIFFYRKK
jgi:hypothetical protein